MTAAAVRAAPDFRALGLKGGVAHPTDGESYKQRDRSGEALARFPQPGRLQSARRIGPSARQHHVATLIATRE